MILPDSRQVRSAYPLYGGILNFSVARLARTAWSDGAGSVASSRAISSPPEWPRFMTASMPRSFPAAKASRSED